MSSLDPYDGLPYKSFPIEWTAPERLALASALHGGPRQNLESYRVLELGCGDGANLLPLAYYRRTAEFVGVDSSCKAMAAANAALSTLDLRNVRFLRTDVLAANGLLDGKFDFIISHGLFSWISDDARDAVLAICGQRLKFGGLVYLNYNAYPGWHVRGIVRRFLLERTAGIEGLAQRAMAAQDVAVTMGSCFEGGQHPYSQLMAREFQFVGENDISYVAHEYLASENHAYWRSEFLALVRRYGLAYVVDADFNYPSRGFAADLPAWLIQDHSTGPAAEDAIDLFCYRQLHSPILTSDPFERRPLRVSEFGALSVASCLVPVSTDESEATFRHPSGYEVDTKEEIVRSVLLQLYPKWPNSVPVSDLFADVSQVMDDLQLLHRNGLIELRYREVPTSSSVDALREFEAAKGRYFTTRYHTREAVSV